MKKKHKKKNKAKGEKTEIILLNIIQALGEKATYHNLVALLADDMHEEEVAEALEVLIENNIITIDKKGRIIYNSSNSQKDTPRKNIYRGTVDLTPGGAAYIVCEDLERDIYVPPRHVRGVLHGDEVLVQIISKDKKRPEGRILEIIKRGQESFIGKLIINNKKAYVAPEGKNIRFSINIPLEQVSQFRNHSKVIARVTDWGKHGEHPTGEVLEQLGSLSPADKEMKMILVQNGFHTTFPDAVIKEAVAIPQTVTEKECKGRLDYRDILTFTIDPVDAKDFDDAISFRKLEDGNIEIGVHIADVSHYVKENSAIDKEAMLRGTSVYLPDRVCPMLPEHLSNIVCSLRPNEDKLAFSVIFIFDKKKEIQDVTIAKTVICSKRRFTYEQVQEILESGKGEFAEELNIIHSITKHIRHKRMKAGAIAFEKEEVRFRLDDSGTPLELYIKHRKDAHLLIEDLMLLANETIARYGSRLTAGKKKGAFVYRVHDKPDPFKLEQFAAIAARYGYNIRFDASDPAQVASAINALMKKVEGRPEEHVLEQMAIRSMAKAQYTTYNIGHYGLAMTHYTHFTSPIRRYPDLMVHRLIYEMLQHGHVKVDREELEERCKLSSLMERKAMDAEREAIRYKQVEYLAGKIGNEYDGIVTGVIVRGIFVEMTELLCEGMVPVENLGEEDFVYDERKLTLRGTRSGKRFQMGDRLKVRVAAADLDTRRVTLELA